MSKKVTVEGLDEAMAMLEDLQDFCDNPQPLFDVVVYELNKETEKAIVGQKSATTGRKYEPLKPSTQKKKGKGPNDALKSNSYNTSQVIKKISGNAHDGMEVEVEVPYADVHQFGNRDNEYYGNRAPIPQRPFLPIKNDGTFTQKFDEKIESIIEDLIEEIVFDK